VFIASFNDTTQVIGVHLIGLFTIRERARVVVSGGEKGGFWLFNSENLHRYYPIPVVL
jgi:hypothetical protein